MAFGFLEHLTSAFVYSEHEYTYMVWSREFELKSLIGLNQLLEIGPNQKSKSKLFCFYNLIQNSIFVFGFDFNGAKSQNC